MFNVLRGIWDAEKITDADAVVIGALDLWMEQDVSMASLDAQVAPVLQAKNPTMPKEEVWKIVNNLDISFYTLGAVPTMPSFSFSRSNSS